MNMSKLIPSIFTTLMILSAAVPVCAQDYQNTEVTVSKDKTRFGGKICYVHVVLERQTLYSITKAYNVTAEELYENNPSLDIKNKGLKAGQILYIPVKKDSDSADNQENGSRENQKVNAEPEEKAGQQKEPKADQKKDGGIVSDVASKIDSKFKDIKDKLSRPESEKQEEAKDRKTSGAAGGDYTFHRVKWFEDLDAIAASYKVSKSSIMNINGMTSEKLSPMQMIKIPKNPQAWEDVASDIPAGQGSTNARTFEPSPEAAASEKESEAQETEPVEEYSGEESDELFDMFGKRKDVRITMIIPYNTKGSNQQMMDFYSGALIAARNLGKAGINIDLEADDVNAGVVNATSERLAKSDFIIGPVANSDIISTVRSTQGKTWIVSPLDPKAEAVADTVSNVIQAPVPAKVQINDMARWILEDTKEGDKVIVIVPKGLTTAYGTDMLNAINATGVSYSTLAFSVVEGRNVMNSLSGMLSQSGTTRIAIASDNKPLVMEAVRNIYLVTSSRKTDVQLYGTAKLRSFEGTDGIDIEQMHSIRTHISGGYFINYGEKSVKDFVRQYRALYNAEPSQTAFQGYDMMTFFTTLCHDYGRKWNTRSNREVLHGLQSDLDLKQSGNGGYINTGVRRVIYEPDFTIQLVR